MGDELDDDFDDDNLINNYDNYDEDEDQESGEENDIDILENEDQAVGEEEEGENQPNNLKKMKRKQKFNEIKLKKKQKMDENLQIETLPCLSNEQQETTVLSSEDQYQLCQQYCPSNLHLSLNQDNFHHILLNNSNKKCSFVQIIHSSLPNFKDLMRCGTNAPGSPYVLIVCSAASRAADVINLISKDMKCKVGKLFAKHFKIQDQVIALRQHFPIVVGTPNRLYKLIEMGALILNDLKLLLIDLELDLKSFSVLNLPGVSEDFYQLLTCSMMENELEHVTIGMIPSHNKKILEKKEKKKSKPKRIGFNKRKGIKAS